MEWMLATWSSGNPRALVNEPLRRYSAVILSNCLQSVDSQLTVLQNFSFRQMVYIILNQTCQMHPTKQEVHPTFRPMHPTCRIVSKWPTFSIKDCTFVYHNKSAVFSCFRTKSTQNGKKQAKRGFGAVNTAAARPFFHLHGR